jgi:dienelactone hydrolase
MWRFFALVALYALAVLGALPLAAADVIPHAGSVAFTPTAAEVSTPERFRMAEHTFPWQATPLGADSDTVEVWDVTFPSPVVTPHENNNTVHAEYYRSKRPGKRPAVIVLHILGGDFPLSRLFCNRLAQQGVTALFVKMPYYGPRRQPGVAARMISPSAEETVAGMTQAVLDIRRATAWLAAQDEVDDEQLGIFGISLGGITGALASTAEPRLQNICLLLAGGDIGRVALDSPEIKKVRGKLPELEGNPERFLEQLALIDPVTYAAQARGRRILLLNASHDEVIPRACTESLWKGLAEPEIVWYAGGHYSVVRHLFGALERVAHFFAAVDGASQPRELVRAETAPVIDGKLDEPLWRDALLVPADRRLGKAGVVQNDPPVVARFAWDNSHLYIGYESASADSTISSRGTFAPSPVQFLISTGSGRQVLEIAHQRDGTFTAAECRVLRRGPRADTELPRDLERSAARPLAGATNAVQPLAKGHTAEIKIPWESLMPGEDFDLSMLEMRLLVATTRASSGAAAARETYTSAELPKQPIQYSVRWWPRYRLAEEQ